MGALMKKNYRKPKWANIKKLKLFLEKQKTKNGK